ncbi:MAG TPA: IscS subfamily cysteine desulfurase [Planctomycetaceae bacterium]|nr:IscS subfamily cysteine desulfurase [Planctomycetaceae bacterium]
MTAPAPRTPIYLDGHATTPLDPRVRDAMWPWLLVPANASSNSHSYGWRAAEAVEQARQQVARLLNCEPRELIFTSGATEANNLALKGVLQSPRAKAWGLVTSTAEHRAVLDPARRLSRRGTEVVFVPVDSRAAIEVDCFRDSLTHQTRLVSLILANNEVGTINPIAQVGSLCQERRLWLHCDASQAVGKIPLDLSSLPVDLLSLSGHKLYGPQGVGALFIRRTEPPLPLEPLFDGGGQEQRLRPGTLPVAAVVGLGTACELAAQEMAEEARRTAGLRDRLWEGLSSRLSGIHRNGDPHHTLPGNLNVSFDGVPGPVLLTRMTEIAVSSGSACSSAEPEPSHVLRAMGVPEALALATLRFGLGRFNTADEIDVAIDSVSRVVEELRTDPHRAK